MIRRLWIFVRWTLGVTRKFVSLKPWMTVGVVMATASKGVLQLVAFMVPLKVILLAASPDVPTYFPFIDPSYKETWVGLLAIGAVCIYVTVQLLSPVIQNWSARAGSALVMKANDLPVSARDIQKVQKIFSDFTSVLASLLFLITTTLILALVDPFLLYWLVFSLVILYWVSARILRGSVVPLPPLKAKFIEKRNDFIGLWESLTFFGAFAVILWPFIHNVDGNVFFALVSFILVRRLLSEVSKTILRSVALLEQREAIDALLYRSHVYTTSRIDPKSLLFRELFAPDSRNRIFSDALTPYLKGRTLFTSRWQDPVPREVKHFFIKEVQKYQSDAIQYDAIQFDVRVYGSDSQFRIRHADFLFQHISKQTLMAPERVVEFACHDYTINIHATNGALLVPVKQWELLRPVLVKKILSIVVPGSLLRSYKSTHALLFQRLTEGLFARLDAAVNSDDDAALLREWRIALPTINNVLQQQPVALINPDLMISNVLQSSDGQSIVLYWGGWRVEPIGAALEQLGFGWQGEDIIDYLKLKRPDLTVHNWNGNLELASLCQQIETLIKRDHTRQAFSLMQRVLGCVNQKEFECEQR